jgi:6-phosphogluconolactonase
MRRRCRLLWRIVQVLAIALPVHAAQETFYLGTYTKPGGSEGIYVGTLDSDTGKLGPLRLAAKETDPNFLALSPDRHFLFAATKDSVASYAVQPDGLLRAINRQPDGGGACHVSIDRAGREVFVANYGAGTISAFPVTADGTLGPRIAYETFSGSGPNKSRQQAPHAHSIYADPEGHFVYSCDLGTDNIWIYHREANGGLTPANPPLAKVPLGSGPRHFFIDGGFVYVVNEMGVSTSVFQRDATTGALHLLQTADNIPSGAKPTSTSAEIALHPSGSWLYVSTRGQEMMTVFRVDRSAAPKLVLTFVQNIASPAKMPRSFGLDPSGHWMIVAGQADNRIAVMKIDPASGQLTLTPESAIVGTPVCVLFMPPTAP